ncbi:MAG: metallophosphoesterase family protein [Planctomycetota bacterium]
MLAILSDIHANIEALQAVIDDMEKHGAERVICLGDVIGYGPNPLECIDACMDFDIVLRGNHEEALLVEMEGSSFNTRAQGSLDWTREKLSMLSERRDENAARWDFLGEIEYTHEEDDRLFLHGTPREPVCEYLRPRDIHDRVKMEDLFSRIDHVCFSGHTHMGGVWTKDMKFQPPRELNYRYDIGDQKTFINPGSVGQSRDGDTRASYILMKDSQLVWRRISYPVETTAEKIRAIPELDPFLADRLLEGR